MGTPKRILVVEDEPSLRRASEIALTRGGYTVLTAADGTQGLRLARTERPDLILLDLLMSGKTGLEVLRALRAEEGTRQIPVLVVSNSTLQRVIDEVTDLGGEYVVKAELSLRDLCERVGQRLAEAAPAPAVPVAGGPAPS